MNPYVRALLPTLFKSLMSLIAGAIVAFAFPLLQILGNLPEVVSAGDPVAQISALSKAGLPIFLATATLIYAIWTFFQLIWAFIKGRTGKIVPERPPEEKIEEEAEKIEAVSREMAQQPKEPDLDKYFKKYVKDEDLKKEEEK